MPSLFLIYLYLKCKYSILLSIKNIYSFSKSIFISFKFLFLEKSIRVLQISYFIYCGIFDDPVGLLLKYFFLLTLICVSSNIFLLFSIFSFNFFSLSFSIKTKFLISLIVSSISFISPLLIKFIYLLSLFIKS
jgi:hypothetical protein